MAEVGLKAEIREGRGKGAARKLRAAGQVPAIVYGLGSEPLPVAVSSRELAHTLSTDAGMNVLIDLQLGSGTELVIARELNKDPVKGVIRHVDFLRINRNQTIEVDVPIHLEGEAPGMKQGGQMDQHTYSLHIEALPGNLPERIDVDISHLQVGDSLRVEDIKAPEGIKILTAGDETVLSIIVAQELPTEAELEEAPVEGEAPSEQAEPSSEASSDES